MVTKVKPLAAKGIPGLRVRNGKFVVDKVVEGVRIYKTLSTGNGNLARRVVARLVNEALEARYFPRRASLTVREALELFWDGHMAHKAYARNARYAVDALLKRLGKCDLSKISRADIETYKRERSKDIVYNNTARPRKVSPRTVQIELQHLSMAINFAVDNGKLKFNPVKRFISVPQGRPKKVVLDDGYEDGPQWTAIRNMTRGRMRDLVSTLYETGMRPKECFNMRWEWLSEKAPGRWVITVPGAIDKTGNEHDIPVSKRLLELFMSMGMGGASAGGLMFPSMYSGERARRSIVSSFRAAVERCGLGGRGITAYALRRTRLTIWDAIDSNACRYAAGHVVDEVHIKHYIRISPERLFKLVGLDFTPSFLPMREAGVTEGIEETWKTA